MRIKLPRWTRRQRSVMDNEITQPQTPATRTLQLPEHLPERALERAERKGGWVRKLLITGVTLTVLVSALFAAQQLLIPIWMERRLVQGLEESAAPVERVQVELKAFPAWQLLQGKVRQLTVDLRRANINGLQVEAFFVDATNLVVDTEALREGTGFIVKTADSFQVSAIIAEDDLNEYVWSITDAAKRFRIRLNPEWTGIEGSISVLGQAVGIKVQGHFAVQAPTKVAFVIDQVDVENSPLPRFLLDLFLPRWQVEIDLAQTTFPLQIRDLRIAQGKLFIYGQRPKTLPQTAAKYTK
ncbi:MAG: DUF2993 domain-containing protein [Limnochordia bacterium]|jgi:hypothetical protein